MMIFLTPVYDRLRRNCVPIVLAFVSLLVLQAAVRAQGGVGSTRGLPGTSGGIHTIQGQVRYPAGNQPEGRIKIRLDSNVSGGTTTSTDSDNAFIFTSLGAGTYTVTAEAGPEYEPARETVTIYGTSAAEGRVSPQSVSVDLQLRLKGTPDPFASLPKAAREAYLKGIEAVRNSDSTKAAELFKKAVGAYPQFGPAWSQLGAQQLKLGQVDDAIVSLRTALKLDPNDVTARQDLGIALLNKKEFIEAEKELREVVSKNAKSATAHMYLGLTLMSLKKNDEAETELAVAVGLPGGDKLAQAHKYLGALYWQKGQKQQAADELEKYVTLSPKAPDADKIRDTIKSLRANK